MESTQDAIVGVRGSRGVVTGVRVGRLGAILASLIDDDGGDLEILGAEGRGPAKIAARAEGFLVLQAEAGRPLRRAHRPPSTGAAISIHLHDERGLESKQSEISAALADGRLLATTEARWPGWVGAVVLEGGVVSGIVESGAEMDGRATLTIRPIAQLDPVLLRAIDPVDPVGWVRVGGSTEPTPHDRESARAVGAELHRKGLGLIHGGGEGIDLAAREGFIAAGGTALRLIGRPEWGDPPRLPPAEGEVISGFTSAVSEASFYGDALVLFDGLDGTRQMIEAARRLVIPVIPMEGHPRGTAAELKRVLFDSWPKHALGGLTRDDYAALRTPAEREALARILAALAQQLRAAGNVKPAAWLADRPSRIDRLGVAAQVERMAEAMVATDATLPIAVGLLGPWGSGKSSFLAMLAERVEALAPSRCGRTCQIHFNAWQYVDTDLWASLAAKLFAEMWRELEPGTTEDERRKVGKELASTREAREAVAAEMSRAEAELAEQRAALQEAKDLRAQRVASLAGLADRDALAALRQTPEYRELATEIGAALKSVGVAEPASATLDELRELGSLVRSAPALIGSLLSPLSRAEWAGLALLLLLPVVAVAVSHWIPVASGAWSVPELLTGALLVLRRARASLERVRDAGNKVALLQARAQELTAQRLAKASAEEVAAGEAVAAAEAAAEAARARLVETEQRMKGLEAHLAEIDAGKLVYDLIQARGGEASVYRTGEGMVARLRRDLDDLSKRLADQRNAYRTATGDKPAAEPIARIVLYIDDLDRCPSHKVVRILEAAQLLLAIDLFVVVMAVDPRWLARSLEREYADVLGAARGAAEARVSAFEYLEKIFQIPYSLSPADKDGFASMLRESLPLAKEAPRLPPPGASASPLSPAPADAAKPPAPAKAEAPPPAELPPPPAPFEVARAEQEFAFRLWQMVDSPRSIKRFVNVYRFLRPLATDADFREFAREDHRIAQLLLATLIGFPRAGTALLRYLIPFELQPPSPPPTEWYDLVKLFPDPADPQIKSECDRMRAALQPFRSQFPPDPVRIARWARRVGPYSFHWSWD